MSWRNSCFLWLFNCECLRESHIDRYEEEVGGSTYPKVQSKIEET